jgi:septum site-determining protein MinD
MSGYVCTVAGGKGGVGKTTTAINIAAVLEAEGHDTVVIDADLGMANLGEMLGVEPDVSIHEILAGDATVSEGLTSAAGGMTAIAGEQTLEAFAEADPAKLRKVIKTLRNTYDVVLVDTGAGLSHETTVPLGLADGVLLVTTPDDVAVSDTVKTADLAARVDGNVIGVLVTRVTKETDLTSIAEQFDCPLLGVTPIDMDAAGNEPLVLNFPDSDAADAYKQLTGGLSSVFFGEASGEAIDRVFEKEWFVDDEEADDDEPDESEEEEESEGVFGGLFG